MVTTDSDAGDTTVYSITAGNTSGAFAVDNAGVITVANPAALDFETLNTFNLTVQVTDSGGLTDSGNVVVTLNDINEAPIDLALAGSAVNENSANGTFIGNVSSTDVDAGDVLTYALADDAGGRFAVDLNSGQLTVADGTLLDHETNSTHIVTVAVDDFITATMTQLLDDPSIVLLANDTDVDGDTLRSAPTNATLTLNPDGTLTYLPTGLFFGADILPTTQPMVH